MFLTFAQRGKLSTHTKLTLALCALTLVLVAGCARLSPSPAPTIPRGETAYKSLEDNSPDFGEARIRPTDKLSVRVLFEPDLSREDLRVDSGGMIDYPLVGRLRAAGLTAQELSAQIRKGLLRYLKKPEVDVSVTSTIGDRVTVEGNVNDPGSFDIGGSATLLEVLARAKSPNKLAKLNEVVVFRTIDDRRLAGVFDVNRIRRGIDRDPRLYPGDTVVVGFSFVKGAYRDFFMIAPVLGIFLRY